MSALVSWWLTATLFFLGLSLGALMLLAISNLSGGRWSAALRPALLAIAAALPVGAVAMILPLAMWTQVLAWTQLPPDALSDVARTKLGYFNPSFLVVRTVVGLAVLLAVWWSLLRPGDAGRGTARSVIALVLILATTLIFVTDWMIAPDPEFYSTIYPGLELSGEVVGAFALAWLVTWAAGDFRNTADPLHGVLLSEDIANLLFGFILLWVYLGFMQWLIIWSGNLPEEIGWYLVRGQGVWLALLVAMAIAQAGAPSVAFLSRAVKRSPRAVAIVAAVALAGHLLDVIWRMAPSGEGGVIAFLAPFISFVVVGAAWSGVAWWLATGRPWPLPFPWGHVNA